jgi:hypothetical protein
MVIEEVKPGIGKGERSLGNQRRGKPGEAE